jgi:hypothetical protein
MKNIFIIIGFIVFLYIIDWGFLKGQITNYKIQCPSDFDGCYTLRYTTYKINKSQQEVVYWIEEFPPSTVKNCSIISRKNWSCKYDDNSAEFGFSSDGYFSYSLKHNENDTKEYLALMDKMDKEQHSVGRLNYLLFKWGLRKYF